MRKKGLGEQQRPEMRLGVDTKGKKILFVKRKSEEEQQDRCQGEVEVR